MAKAPKIKLKAKQVTYCGEGDSAVIAARIHPEFKKRKIAGTLKERKEHEMDIVDSLS